jgi:hypothetical protein
MYRNFLLILLIPFLVGCQNSIKNLTTTTTKSVGDIAYDNTTDKKDFILCDSNNIKQYHNNQKGLEYKGEKIAIVEEFSQNYVPVKCSNCDGLIRIRFIVNCKGETDRFRVISMNEKYEKIAFNSKVTQQLLAICKSLKGWIPKKIEGKEIDYYQYLIFKINDGQIIEIMP